MAAKTVDIAPVIKPVPSASDESDTDTTADENTDSEYNGIEPVILKFAPKMDRVGTEEQIRSADEDDMADYDYSMKCTGAGKLEWEMHVCKSWYKYNVSGIRFEGLEVGVKCLNVSRQWTADARVEINITDNNGKILPHSKNHVFRWDKISTKRSIGEWKDFIDPEKARSTGYVDANGAFNIEVKITFRALTGVIVPKKHNFSSSSRLSDAILVVKGRKLHVSSQTLALASPVFEQLFYDDNCSSTDKQEYRIKKVGYKDFLGFLNHLYSPNTPITVGTVETLLALANRFKSEAVTDKAQQFILDSADFSIEHKLLMADTYVLVTVMDHCLNQLDTMDKIKKIVDTTEYEKVSDKMKIELLERLVKKVSTTLGRPYHLAAILILLWKMWMSRSVSGISARSQILYFIVFVTRYLDLSTTYISAYNSLMKIFFLGSTVFTIYLMLVNLRSTYEKESDSFRIELLLLPTTCLALVFNHHFEVIEIHWTFSIYLEAVAIFPQLFMLQKIGSAETITAHYVVALGIYRGFYILN